MYVHGFMIISLSQVNQPYQKGLWGQAQAPCELEDNKVVTQSH